MRLTRKQTICDIPILKIRDYFDHIRPALISPEMISEQFDLNKEKTKELIDVLLSEGYIEAAKKKGKYQLTIKGQALCVARYTNPLNKEKADKLFKEFMERVEEIKLDKKLVRSLDFHTMESGFLVPDYMGEHRFWEVDGDGKAIQNHGTIPSEAAEEETSRPALAQAWRPFMDYNPDNGILAMATQLGETLEIYNLKDSTHKVLYGPNGEPEFKTARDGSGVPDGIMGFNDIKVTDKYIYAVFQGMKLKDELAAYKQGKELEDGGRFIYVFDLKGNPVQKYTLDHAIHGIDVNEETNTIVATEVKSDDPIIEFKI